jgi:SAM-dependent methyltransferase
MDGQDLARLYRNRFPEAELARRQAIWDVICRSFLQQFIGAADVVVDIACGYGEFLNGIRAGRRVGIDPNPDARARLAPGIEFHQCEAARLPSIVPDGVDVVFASNFLEHLPDKRALDSLLRTVFLALRPSGRLLVLGPNLRYLPGAYWDFYDHHLGLTHASLSEALALQGFAIERCIPRFLPYTTRGSLPTHPALVWAYVQLPFAWRLFGKQFFIVARRAG